MFRMNILLFAVGWVHSSENGPREDYWGDVVSEIRLDEQILIPRARRTTVICKESVGAK
jgi:hypothetical protein